jgi:putative ribosome biogenesis GTPase RsgA
MILREGVRVAIVGKPNVGKSSLLNRLLRADQYMGHHRDCIVLPAGSKTSVFGRLVPREEGGYLLVPAEPGAPALIIEAYEWIAPIITLIRHY